MKNIFVTGGLGYIGSHLCLTLLEQGYHVTIYDDLSNSDPLVFQTIKNFAQRKQFDHTGTLCIGDILDKKCLKAAMSAAKPDVVIHLAGVKSVPESVSNPDKYTRINQNGTSAVLTVMGYLGISKILFSSSAAVYGSPEPLSDGKIPPISETASLLPGSPYGLSKLHAEMAVEHWATISGNMESSAVSLRYFNPVGTHDSGILHQEDKVNKDHPERVNRSLITAIGATLQQKQPHLDIFGRDYPTPDGYPVRDYIHIMDLVLGHIAALRFMACNSGHHIFNLGSGCGYSVQEVLTAYNEVNNVSVPFVVQDRRPGDCAYAVADTSKASQYLLWSAHLTLADMVRSYHSSLFYKGKKSWLPKTS